jgi:Ankyrin repeats (3 copies)
MDTTYPSGTATLAVLADGTVSLYATTGGGVIGGGSHERVAAAARELLAVAEGHLAAFAQDGPGDLPPTRGTLITLRTHAGPRSLSASETDLSLNRHPASPVFRSAHQVIAQLRMTESGTGQDRDGTERFPGEVTPLMAAAHHGDQQAVAHWIDQGIPIDVKDDKGYTALMYAANAGQDEIVRLLLANNADPNVSDNQQSTPLMFAAQHDHLSIVRQLLAARADSRARGTHGLTALGFAQQMVTTASPPSSSALARLDIPRATESCATRAGRAGVPTHPASARRQTRRLSDAKFPQ